MNDESTESSDSFILEIASEAHVGYAEQISKMLEQSTKARGIGIAKRPPMQIQLNAAANKLRNPKLLRLG